MTALQRKFLRFEAARAEHEDYKKWVRELEIQAIRKNLLIGNPIARKSRTFDQEASTLSQEEGFQRTRKQLLQYECTRMSDHDHDVVDGNSLGRSAPTVPDTADCRRDEIKLAIEHTCKQALPAKFLAVSCDNCYEYIINCRCKLTRK